MAKNDPLPQKYVDALALLKEGILTNEQIYTKCKINKDNFYELLEERYTESPHIQAEFTKIYSEIERARDKEIRNLVKSNKKDSHIIIQKYLKDNLKKKNVDQRLISTIVSVANALSKSTPNVEIGSFSYTKGLSAEDIANEWHRLKGIAEGRLNGRGVFLPPEGRTGESPMVEGTGTTTPEEPEDPIL